MTLSTDTGDKGGDSNAKKQTPHRGSFRKPHTSRSRHRREIRVYRGESPRLPEQKSTVEGGVQQKHTGSRRRGAGQNSRKNRSLQNGDVGENGNGVRQVDIIPPLKEDSVRIIPLGGVEEIGRNMTVIEYKHDIVIVDCGFQFREDTTPGIDYILPNTKYLEDNKEKIRAIVITHGHLDHIGGIPYIVERIGSPPIYSRRLTNMMIKKRQEEFPQMPKLDIREVEKDEAIRMGNLTVRFFAVTHTIPDSMGIIVETPYGSIIHTGDLKLDHVDGVPTEKEEEEFKKFDKENVLLLMADSTNVERPGYSFPEAEVHKNIEEFIKEARGRLVIGTFASQLERIVKIIELAEKYKKKIVIEGRSMKTNIEIVRELKMLSIKKESLISVEQMSDHPDNKIIVLATGAQGDEFSALMRIATKSHRHFKIKSTDTVLLSSSIIPGNERAVQKLKDNLSRQGAKIIHYQVAGVHSSGHANRDETAWIHKRIKPKFFIPLHGYHYMLRVHTEVALECGMQQDHIVIPDNGSVIEIQNKGEKMVHLKERAPSGLRMVDGFSVGDVQEVLIRDRKMLAQEGMFVIIATVNLKTGKLRKSPDIISRGFVYLRESQELLQQTRLIIKRTVENTASGMNPINFDYIKTNVTDDVSRFLFQKTNKRPIVIPVILGV
jgi:ribonuclease J